MPGSKDAGQNIQELYHRNESLPPEKRRSPKQIKAIGLSQAREAGARISRRKKKPKRPKRPNR